MLNQQSQQPISNQQADAQKWAQRIACDLEKKRSPKELLIVEETGIVTEDEQLKADIEHVQDCRNGYWKVRIHSLTQRYPMVAETQRVLPLILADLATSKREPAPLMPKLARSIGYNHQNREPWGRREGARQLLQHDVPNFLHRIAASLNLERHFLGPLGHYDPDKPDTVLRAGAGWATATSIATQLWMSEKDTFNNSFGTWPNYKSKSGSFTPLPTQKEDDGPVRLCLTLPWDLSQVINPDNAQSQLVDDGRRTTEHCLNALRSETFNGKTYHYALKNQDIYFSLWLDTMERIAPLLAAVGAPLMTHSNADKHAVEAAFRRLTSEVQELVPTTYALQVEALLLARGTPPAPTWRANIAGEREAESAHLLAEQTINSARYGERSSSFQIRCSPASCEPVAGDQDSMSVELELPTMNRDPLPMWISSLILLQYKGRWYSLDHEFFECPSDSTRQCLSIASPIGISLNIEMWKRAWKSLRYIESDIGLGTDWIGVMRLGG